MSDSREFCPRCGDPVAERSEPRPGEPRTRDRKLCDDCYFEDFDLVDAPDRIEVLVCSGCGAVRRGESWRDVGARDYTDVAVDETAEALGVHVDAAEVNWGVEPEQVDENTIRMHCEFSGVVRGTLREESVTVPVKISRGTCDRCGRIAGGYYAAIVQIRADERDLTPAERDQALAIAESHVADQEAKGDREAFITEVTETEDGPNVKISSNGLGQSVATRIVEQLGGSFESYPTLVTEDGDGNEVYRVTFAVRLPRYAAGEIIDPNDGDGPVLVESVSGRLRGIRLASGEEYVSEFAEGETPDADRVGRRDDAVETTVVTVEDEHAVQVLDPETYAAVTVPNPDFFDDENPPDVVFAIKHDGEVYLVPDEAESDADVEPDPDAIGE
ncbi:60S ribosomal export protein NMD3 [Halopenitus persicus]|uniref:60S ribosomal export protein NMD3 n=1 Tax=Halopenitus persicus TaxID=1048396 RepID=UPI000BBB513E|nr:60S ribosomal export protein NMD3 [Halopenitus persicus]